MRSVENHFINGLADVYSADEAKYIARLCLQHVLNTDLAHLLAASPLTLSSSQSSALEGLLSRLAAYEPLQYVLGSAEFCGLSFSVNPSVLIPRPETSELVDWVCRDCESRSSAKILDVCTGSGCIAVSLASRLHGACVSALDVSLPALDVARANASDNGVDVHFFQHDMLSSPVSLGAFDIIVSNPPYVCEAEKADMDRNVLDFEPHLALFVSDDDPLVFYRQIASFALLSLNPGGALFFEINERFGPQCVDLLTSLGFHDVVLNMDVYGKNRMVRAYL